MTTPRPLALLALLAFTLTHVTAAQAEETSSSAPEPAPPPPIVQLLTGDAKRDYESARLLYDNGDYAGASVKFQSAYELSRAQNSKWEGDPRLLWNAAPGEHLGAAGSGAFDEPLDALALDAGDQRSHLDLVVERIAHGD